MKKAVYYTFAVMALAMGASCSSDESFAPSGGEGVEFTLKIPHTLSTRGSFGDGTAAGDRAVLNEIQWTVYSVTGVGTEADPYVKTPLFGDGRAAFSAENQTTEKVTIPLAKGKQYQVVFYAANDANAFVEYNQETGKFEVDYTKAQCNTANEDVFVGVSNVIKIGENGTTDPDKVILTRPFAQLNWGTNDLAEPALKNLLEGVEAKVTVSSGLYTTYDVLSGAVSGEVTASQEFGPVTCVKGSDGTFSFASQSFPASVVPAEGEDPYSLIAMNYLLTGDGTIQCNLSLSGEDLTTVNIPVENADVKTNFRTNIYGAFFTAPGIFNIEVDNAFADDDINVSYPTVPAWDGTEEAPADPVDGVYTIESPAQFAYLVHNIKHTDYWTSKTINITTDMDFSGQEWTPMSIKSNSDTDASLVWDFNGHTIYGLTTALFNEVHGTVRNLTISGANITTQTNNVNGYVGILANEIYATLDNVNVLNSTIDCTKMSRQGRSVGAIAGQYSSGNATNCSVKNLTIIGAAADASNRWKAGALFGAMLPNNTSGQVERNLTGCTVEGLTMEGYTTVADDATIGSFVGRLSEVHLHLVNCTASDVEPAALPNVGRCINGATFDTGSN